jgi:hypothetical protein
MLKKRKRKKSDQCGIEKAYQLLLRTMHAHPEIEQTLWAGACWTALINGYAACGATYEEFCQDFDGAKAHYSKWWNEREDET